MLGELFSIICVYNDSDILESVLKKSLKEQSINAELIAIDNTKNKYSSAAAALNYGASLSHGDILIFAHQDVSFEASDALYRLVVNFKKCASVGDVGGVVGVVLNEQKTPQIVAGSDINFLGEKVGEKGFQTDYLQAETVDELLILMYKKTFNAHPFDEKVCDGWHFYAVEQCLYAKENNKKVFVINSDIRHISSGNIDAGFYRAQFKLAKKYKNKNRIISTCCDFEPRPLFNIWLNAVKYTIKAKITRC